jgi:hypothetical protein
MRHREHPDKPNKPYEMKYANYAKLAMSLTLLTLTNCAPFSSKNEKPQLNIFQPPILNLQAKEPIQTLNGIYTPQTDEVWHSDKRFQELEQQAMLK